MCGNAKSPRHGETTGYFATAARLFCRFHLPAAFILAWGAGFIAGLL